jgi:hypothetical protein
MPIIGHQITKIVGKRGVPERNLTVNTNVELTDVAKKDVLIAAEKKEGIDFEFEFTIQYGEKAGGINILGTLFYTADEQVLEKIVKQWKKDKKIDPAMMIMVLNKAMELGYLESIPLSERLRLPIPLKIPKFTAEAKKK